MDYNTTFSKIFKRGGFDAVVGNPPYLSTKGIHEIEKKYFINTYSTAKGQFDLYGLFIEKGYSILEKNGKFGYITSNTFLSNKDFISLRKLLLDKCDIEAIANFGETVFKDANLDVCILIYKKGNSKNSITIYKNDKDFFANKSTTIKQATFNNETNNYEIQINLENRDLAFIVKLFKNEKTLGNYLSLPRGIELGSNSDLISNTKQVGYSKLLVGKNIKKYEINFKDYYIKHEENEKSVFKEINIYNQPKILIQRIRNLSLPTRIVATLDIENYLCTNTLRIGILKNNEFNIKFFLGVLNSKIINYLFSKKFLNKDIYAYQLDRIPIPNLNLTNKSDKENHDTLVNLVEQMLDSKQKLQSLTLEKDKNYYEQKCSRLDSQIDTLVYALYGLTEEEIRIVEG